MSTPEAPVLCVDARDMSGAFPKDSQFDVIIDKVGDCALLAIRVILTTVKNWWHACEFRALLMLCYILMAHFAMRANTG